MTKTAVLDACTAGALLPIHEACRRAAACCQKIADLEEVALIDSIGRTLAEPVIARMALPPFTQSAMDGYALCSGQGLVSGTPLQVVGRSAAGHLGGGIRPGEALRLFTGTMLPPGADAVIMQEHVSKSGDVIQLQRNIRAGDNIRHKGEDVEPLESLLDGGLRIDARHIALMAAQGITFVPVRRKPRIAILSTGDELQMPGTALAAAAIYDSNSPMLLSLGKQAGLDMIDAGWVRDDPKQIALRLSTLAQIADLVVTSGGASVGEEDHSARSVALAGGQSQILKIALKPGKPAVVGTIGRAAYLGLPGNPVSSLVSWLLVGQAMIAAFEGRHSGTRLGCPMVSVSRFDRQAGRTEFVPARLVRTDAGIAAEILGRGGSARLKPLTLADGLAEIAASNAGVMPGDQVIFHPFKDGFVV